MAFVTGLVVVMCVILVTGPVVCVRVHVCVFVCVCVCSCVYICMCNCVCAFVTGLVVVMDVTLVVVIGDVLVTVLGPVDVTGDVVLIVTCPVVVVVLVLLIFTTTCVDLVCWKVTSSVAITTTAIRPVTVLKMQRAMFNRIIDVILWPISDGEGVVYHGVLDYWFLSRCAETNKSHSFNEI